MSVEYLASAVIIATFVNKAHMKRLLPNLDAFYASTDETPLHFTFLEVRTPLLPQWPSTILSTEKMAMKDDT